MPAILTAGPDGKAKTPAACAYRVEILGRPGLPDAAGAALLHQLPGLGVSSVTEVKAGTIYEIRGPYSLSQMTAIAAELLSDPITQDFAVNGQRPAGALWSPHWRIEVWLKSTVTDPAESSLRQAVQDLGMPAPASARAGAVFKFWGRLQSVQAERIALKLLANPVVHRYTVESC